MKKKIISIALVLVLTFAIMPLTASAENPPPATVDIERLRSALMAYREFLTTPSTRIVLNPTTKDVSVVDFSPSRLRSAELVDFDGDGIPELVVTVGGYYFISSGERVYLSHTFYVLSYAANRVDVIRSGVLSWNCVEYSSTIRFADDGRVFLVNSVTSPSIILAKTFYELYNGQWVSRLTTERGVGGHDPNVRYINGRRVRPYEYDAAIEALGIIRMRGFWSFTNLYSLLTYIDNRLEALSYYVHPTQSSIYINGIPAQIEAYLINGNNFFRLRDLAYALSGTEKQFDVRWDEAAQSVSIHSNTPYTIIGGENAPGDGGARAARPNNDLIVLLDGESVEITAFLIDGSNFVRLRDVMRLLDIGVIWDEDAGAVLIDTAGVYVG